MCMDGWMCVWIYVCTYERCTARHAIAFTHPVKIARGHTHARTHTHTHTHTTLVAQIAAMREGFASVVPSLVLPLFTWRQIEMRICGNAEIDIEALKNITQYDMPRGEQHPVAIMFWNVVKTFSNDDRAALLGFASGRRRLPAGTHVLCVGRVYACICLYICSCVC